MRKFNFSLSTRLFLMLGLIVPSAFTMTSEAQAKPVKASESVQNKPFIQQNARPDTLGNLHKAPIGNVLQNDGGTGKEASDKGKDACDKCKESSDGSINGIDQVILPADRIKPGQIQKIKSNQLIKSTKPIF